jgi:hypothetical protein
MHIILAPSAIDSLGRLVKSPFVLVENHHANNITLFYLNPLRLPIALGECRFKSARLAKKAPPISDNENLDQKSEPLKPVVTPKIVHTSSLDHTAPQRTTPHQFSSQHEVSTRIRTPPFPPSSCHW